MNNNFTNKRNLVLFIGILFVVNIVFFVSSVSAATHYINDCVDLQNMQLDLDGDYYLNRSIDCINTSKPENLIWDSNGFKPVGNDTAPFTGTFNGQNYTISNLYINRSDEYNVGLFGYTNGGIISNVRLTNFNIIGLGRVGSLIGYNFVGTIINNIYSSGNIIGTGDIYIGGLVGRNYEGIINNSHSEGNLTYGSYCGGITGENFDGSIINSNSTMFVDCSFDYVGGLVGKQYYGNISNSYATGNVNGSNYIGGLVGYNGEGLSIINNSYAIGNVTALYDFAGGLVGVNTFSNISNSYATGNVTGGDDFVGGLAGTNYYSSISSSYSTGQVIGNDTVGGLSGVNTFSNITNSYATGNVNGNKTLGGLVGTNLLANITNSYATSNITGNIYIGGLVGNFSVNLGSSGGSISNSFSTGNVSGSNFTGSLIGNIFNSSNVTISNSYWNNHSGNYPHCWSNTTGNYSINCTAIADNVAYFQGDVYPSNAPMSSWDFVNVWKEVDGGFPILRWQIMSGGDGPWCNGVDINHNGVVDSADYTLWRDKLGCVANSGNNWCNYADVNRNGVVDQADYDLWKANFGKVNCIGSSSGNGGNTPNNSAVDKDVPIIFRNNPAIRKGIGRFDVWFKEKNPEELVLKYGNKDKGFKSVDLSLDNCKVYGKDGNRRRCLFNINLGKDGYKSKEKIYFWFELTDSAGNSVTSRIRELRYN